MIHATGKHIRSRIVPNGNIHILVPIHVCPFPSLFLSWGEILMPCFKNSWNDDFSFYLHFVAVGPAYDARWGDKIARAEIEKKLF